MIMSILNICPCCSASMLHHISNHREYWFCRHCWQEMPDWENIKEHSYSYRKSKRVLNLSVGSKVLTPQY